MKISSIVFDLDNTLYPESAYFKAIFEHFCQLEKIPFATFDFLFEQFDHFRFTEKDIFRFALNRVNLFSENRHESLFNLFTGIETCVEPYPNVTTFISEAIERGLRLYVLTNGQIKAQTNKWRCLEIPEKNRIFFVPSREYGKDKPASETFDRFVAEARIHLQSIVFIGDRFTNDIEWGLKHGAQGILVNTAETHPQVPTFQDAAEVWHYIQQRL